MPCAVMSLSITFSSASEKLLLSTSPWQISFSP